MKLVVEVALWPKSIALDGFKSTMYSIGMDKRNNEHTYEKRRSAASKHTFCPLIQLLLD